MKKKLGWFLPVLLLVAGCMTTYAHPTKNNVQFEKDRVMCERVARKTLAAKGIT